MNRASSLLLAAAMQATCVPPDLSLEGKECSTVHPCPSGTDLVCSPYTFTCAHDALCPFATTPAPCSGRDIYVSPTGDDARDGMDSAKPRKSADGLSLFPGDRIHLAAGIDREPWTLDTAGGAGCPITLAGTPELGSVLGKTLAIRASHWRVVDLVVDAPNSDMGIDISSTQQPLEDIRVERVQVRNVARSLGGPGSASIQMSAASSAVVASTLDALNIVPVVLYRADGFLFRGNTVKMQNSAFGVGVDGLDARIEGNDFTGDVSGPVVAFMSGSSGGMVARNVFHDVALPPGAAAVSGAAATVSNTFMRIGADALASDMGAFSNNVIAQVARGSAQAVGAGGFNLFDGVTTPYQGSSGPMDVARSDVLGASRMDANFVPGADSPAVDAADPTLPVPPGGGRRADIGAIERGATRLPDGRYCLPEARP